MDLISPTFIFSGLLLGFFGFSLDLFFIIAITTIWFELLFEVRVYLLLFEVRVYFCSSICKGNDEGQEVVEKTNVALGYWVGFLRLLQQ
jgi:hypothetical protein